MITILSICCNLVLDKHFRLFVSLLSQILSLFLSLLRPVFPLLVKVFLLTYKKHLIMQNNGVPLGSILALHFCYYTLMVFLIMLSDILLTVLMMLLSTVGLIRHLICSINQSCLLNLNLTCKTLYTGTGSGMLISILEKFNLFCLTGAIDLITWVQAWRGKVHGCMYTSKALLLYILNILYGIIMSRTSFSESTIYNLPECQGTPCSKHAHYLKFK